MKSRLYVSSAAAIAVASFAVGPAQAAHIDTFQDGAFDLTVDSVGQTQTSDLDGLDQDEVLGGSRLAELTFDASDEDPVDEINARVRPTAGTADAAPAGRLSLSSDAGEEGTLNLTYGFDDVGGSMDVESNGSGPDYDGFFFNITQADAGTEFNVTATDTDGDNDTESQTTGTGNSDLTFDFANFEDVDFSSLDSILVSIDGSPSGDYTLANFRRTEGEAQAIPTPAALPAGLLMLGGMLVNRRRRKAQA